jgi:hypothetical protein
VLFTPWSSIGRVLAMTNKCTRRSDNGRDDRQVYKLRRSEKFVKSKHSTNICDFNDSQEYEASETDSTRTRYAPQEPIICRAREIGFTPLVNYYGPRDDRLYRWIGKISEMRPYTRIGSRVGYASYYERSRSLAITEQRAPHSSAYYPNVFDHSRLFPSSVGITPIMHGRSLVCLDTCDNLPTTIYQRSSTASAIVSTWS